jgi:phospholipid/cholesterol/gamma-HCH transport system substrate-binding protein
MFVELDQKKEGEPDRSPKLTFPSEYPIVASKPSDIEQLLRGVDEIIKNMRSLDLAGISDRVKTNLDTIETTINDLNVKGLSRKAESALDGFNRIVDKRKWDNIMASAEKSARSLNEVMAKANATVDRADKLLAQMEGITVESRNKILAALDDLKKAMEKGTVLVNNTDSTLFSLRQHLLAAAQNVEKTSENLNRISEVLTVQPSQLLFGEPPPRRQVQPEVSRGE